MDAETREDLKRSMKASIYNYVSNYKPKSVHPLDLLIPKERKIRSVVGGLETSWGTTIWEPVAKTLAAKNGFEVISDKILKPKPMPKKVASLLASLIELREDKTTWLSAKECKKQLRDACRKLDWSKVKYVAPASGTGVDILLKKDNKYYAYDTKTVQPNLGSIKGFNKQILEWYAYSICRQTDIDINCMIAYPYNPFKDDFWSRSPHNKGVLEPHVDALLENEFWDFLSGHENTYQVLTDILEELNSEGFGKEISQLIEQKHLPEVL